MTTPRTNLRTIPPMTEAEMQRRGLIAAAIGAVAVGAMLELVTGFPMDKVHNQLALLGLVLVISGAVGYGFFVMSNLIYMRPDSLSELIAELVEDGYDVGVDRMCAAMQEAMDMAHRERDTDLVAFLHRFQTLANDYYAKEVTLQEINDSREAHEREPRI